MKKIVFFFIFLWFSASWGGTSYLVGTSLKDSRSHHLPSYHIASLDSTVYRLYETEWVFKINPEIYFTLEGENYDLELPEAHFSRYFAELESEVTLGKTNRWILGEVISLNGVKQDFYFSQFKRQLTYEMGTLTRADEEGERLVGTLIQVGFSDRALSEQFSYELKTLVFNTPEGLSRAGQEVNFDLKGNTFSLKGELKSLGSDNLGHSVGIYNNSFLLQLQKPLESFLSDREEEDELKKAFTAQTDLWAHFHINRRQNHFQLMSSVNLNQEDWYRVTLASPWEVSYTTLSPYTEYTRLQETEQLLGGVSWEHSSLLKLDLGSGIRDIEKRPDTSQFYFGEMTSSYNFATRDKLSAKVRYQHNEWMKNDLVASAFYHHYF